MQIVIDIPKSLYANLQKIQNGSIAAKRILECVRNGKLADVPDTNVGEYINREDALMCLTGEWTELTDEVIHRFIKRIKNLPLMVFPKHIECEDCVSREAVDKLFSDAYESKSVNLNEDWKKLIWIREHIKELPPVTPAEEVGHWEWVQYDGNPNIGNWYCSECRSIVIECATKEKKGDIPLYKYCPQCGIKMQEVEEEC